MNDYFTLQYNYTRGEKKYLAASQGESKRMWLYLHVGLFLVKDVSTNEELRKSDVNEAFSWKSACEPSILKLIVYFVETQMRARTQSSPVLSLCNSYSHSFPCLLGKSKVRIYVNETIPVY